MSCLTCIAVTHFPELLVAPPSSVHHHPDNGENTGQGHYEIEEEEEEEESTVLWHLLQDACDSEGLVAAGHWFQHYSHFLCLKQRCTGHGVCISNVCWTAFSPHLCLSALGLVKVVSFLHN